MNCHGLLVWNSALDMGPFWLIPTHVTVTPTGPVTTAPQVSTGVEQESYNTIFVDFTENIPS